jgi:gliding motility-associated-like protein
MKTLFLLPFFALSVAGWGQNLVYNPSFESSTACPTFASMLNLATPWYNPTSGTPEYFNACAIYTDWVSVPAQPTGGFQDARTGNAYAGLFTYRQAASNMREYIEAGLTNELVAGNCYYFEMYVNQPNDHPYVTDGIGAYFSPVAVSSGTSDVLPYIPQVDNPVGNVISDTLAWVKVSGYFTAVGGEKYLTIGNFRNDANTTASLMYPGVWYFDTGYLLVDDVSLVLVDLDVELGNDTLLCNGDHLLLDATSAYPDVTYLWQDGSTSPTFLVNNSGIYYVTVTAGECSATDTIYVNAASVPDIQLNDTTACTGLPVTLDITTNDAAYLWNDGTTNPVHIITTPGTYWVSVTTVCGSDTDTMQLAYEDCYCTVFTPGAFTPNGDHLNDGFAPVMNCTLLQSYQFRIFNRWGEEVYVTSNYMDRWDGAEHGSQSPQSVYTWKLNYTANSNGNIITEERIGKVVLIR